jgi:hypothetical protein
MPLEVGLVSLYLFDHTSTRIFLELLSVIFGSYRQSFSWKRGPAHECDRCYSQGAGSALDAGSCGREHALMRWKIGLGGEQHGIWKDYVTRSSVLKSRYTRVVKDGG